MVISMIFGMSMPLFIFGVVYSGIIAIGVVKFLEWADKK